jgi:hypothetical protein
MGFITFQSPCIKTDQREIGFDAVDEIKLTHDRIHSQTLMSVILNL